MDTKMPMSFLNTPIPAVNNGKNQRAVPDVFR